MTLRRLSERLARHGAPGPEAPEPELARHAHTGPELSWSYTETPFGRATVSAERLDAGPFLSSRRPETATWRCHHPLERLLGDERLIGFRPEDALYLDIEATGLSHGAGTFAFLIGCAVVEGGQVHVEQLFVPDPTDELPALSRFLELLDARPYLVSFNGKSYDLSVLESRLVITRLLSRSEASLKLRPHLDLLHVSRQAYKGVFGDTRLQTLERAVLGLDPKEREDDVPGSLVPALYFHYLRTGDARHLEPVLRHNRTDVLSMVALAAHLVDLLRAPCGDAEILLNLGRAALRRGLPDRAARLLEDALAAGLADPLERLALEDLVTAARRAERPALHAFALDRLIDLLTPHEATLLARLTRARQRLRPGVAGQPPSRITSP